MIPFVVQAIKPYFLYLHIPNKVDSLIWIHFGNSFNSWNPNQVVFTTVTNHTIITLFWNLNSTAIDILAEEPWLIDINVNVWITNNNNGGVKKKTGEKMLTCITCSKQPIEDGEEGAAPPRGTPSTKEAVKSLTAQVLFLTLLSCPWSFCLFFYILVATTDTSLDCSPDWCYEICLVSIFWIWI